MSGPSSDSPGGVSRITEVGKLARLPAGRRSKWAALVFWLIVAALVAGPAGKLMGAQKNDAVSWLPGNAESTKVIQASSATAHFTGPGGVAADSSAAFSGIDGKLLYSALAVVIVILLLTYRSPVLWLLPVISAGLALPVAQAWRQRYHRGCPPLVKGDLAYLAGTLSVAPDSQVAIDIVGRVRDAIHQVPGEQAIAGGDSATCGDTLAASSNDNKVIIPLILLVVFLILMALLRAVVAPLILIGTVVLSFGATLGLSALVFRHALHFAGADSSLPLFVFVFLVTLGIDYNIFLMTRVHEESTQYGTRAGALIGLAATGGVITSAGLVLAGTFSVLATLPVVSFAEIGFAAALGVLLDTLIVRPVLGTALDLDVGRHMWWPSRRAHQRAASGALRRDQTAG